MAATITEMSIRGYKSIERLDRLRLRPLNVLVGANGAGKSNLLSFVALVGHVADESARSELQVSGGADALLHLGPKVTRDVQGRLAFADFAYAVTLLPRG